LLEQRDALEKAHAAAVNTDKAIAFKDRQNFERSYRSFNGSSRRRRPKSLAKAPRWICSKL
jgi:hypothetical protein